MNPEKRTILPSVAFSGFKGRFEEPKVEEGFEDIVKIDFTVCAIPREMFYSFISLVDY